MSVGFLQTGYASLLVPFILVIFVIFAAYLGTKFISQKYAKISSGKHLQIMERVALGQDKSLVLVRINKKIYLLGVSGKGINVVSEFDEDNFPSEPELTGMDFSSLLSENFKKWSAHLPVGKFGKKTDGKK